MVKFLYGKRTSQTSNKVKVEYRPTEIETQGINAQLLLTLGRTKIKLIRLRGFSITMLLAKLNNENKHEKISVRG